MLHRSSILYCVVFVLRCGAESGSRYVRGLSVVYYSLLTVVSSLIVFAVSLLVFSLSCV